MIRKKSEQVCFGQEKESSIEDNGERIKYECNLSPFLPSPTHIHTHTQSECVSQCDTQFENFSCDMAFGHFDIENREVNSQRKIVIESRIRKVFAA